MEFSRDFAQQQDKQDILRKFRWEFYFPLYDFIGSFKADVLYFTGNSLGLQPKSVKNAIDFELKKWANEGVEGHFKGEMPWKDYHIFLREDLAYLVGSDTDEVAPCNSLTVNLQLLLISFYQPKGKRTKIIMEGGAFPSDQYALETQVRLHNLNPDTEIIEIYPRAGEYTLHTEDILAKIAEVGEELALVLFGGVNYYTGQFFDIEKITQKTHEVGAIAGFDLAHTIGNLPLKLKDWNVDFAVWCSYKYLNSGAGGVGGMFVAKKHHNTNRPRLAGWWGYDAGTRFQMKKGFVPEPNVDAWQLSNVPILLLASHKEAIKLFKEANMEALREKSKKLTAYLQFILEKINEEKNLGFQIITPKNPEERGCQLSIFIPENGRELFDFLTEKGVITDWREPNVMRFAPVPLYNSFEDVYKLGKILREF